MLANLPGVSAHFSRFPVTHISGDDSSRAQFDPENLVAAAELLAQAKVDVIVWSGTAASWLGFDTDEIICSAISERTGIPAASAVLGINALFGALDVRRFALVSPYESEIQNQIRQNYAQAGFDCVCEHHLNLQDNFSFATVTEQAIESALLDCADERPDAITIMCTNMRGALPATHIESTTGIPVVDSTAAAVWHAFSVAGVSSEGITGWGRLFSVKGRQ